MIKLVNEHARTQTTEHDAKIVIVFGLVGQNGPIVKTVTMVASLEADRYQCLSEAMGQTV